MANVQVRLFGDTAKAATYVGWAKNQCVYLVGQCKGLGLPFLERTYMVGADIAVRIHASATDYAQNWVSVEAGSGCTLFVYHGLLLIGNYAPLHLLRYESPLLYTDAAHLSGNTLWGTVWLDKAGVVPLLTDKRPTAAPYPSGTAIPEFSKPVFPPTAEQTTITAGLEAFRATKEALAQCPSSMYSGKLRLFVQALFGAASTLANKRRWSITAAGGIPTVRVTTQDAAITLVNWGQTSHGIYTDTEGTYWLVQVFPESTYRVLVTKMIPTPCGGNLLAWLRNAELSREARAVVEAFVLADITIDPTFSFVIDTKVLASGHGTPIAYGWSFTWNGANADMTTQAHNGQVGAASRYKSYHVSLILDRQPIEFAPSAATKIEEEKARWTANITVVPRGDWMTRFGYENIWYPSYSQNVHELYQDLHPAVTGAGAGEIYSFYDKTDSLVTISVSISNTASYTVTTRDPLLETPGGSYFYMAGFTGRNSTYTYGAGHRGEITITGSQTISAFSIPLASGAEAVWRAEEPTGDREGFMGYGSMVFAQPSDPNYEQFVLIRELSGYTAAQQEFSEFIDGRFCGLSSKFEGKTSYAEYVGTQYSSGSDSTRGIIVIPFGDCSGVFVGDSGLRTYRAPETKKTFSNPKWPAETWFRTDCFGGSPWFSYKNVSDTLSPSSIVTETGPVIDTQGAQTRRYVGYGGVSEMPPGWVGSLVSPVKSAPTSSAIYTSIASAVEGATIYDNSTLIGSYAVSSASKAFIGAA